jgi:hypothetical protein
MKRLEKYDREPVTVTVFQVILQAFAMLHFAIRRAQNMVREIVFMI